MAVRFEYRGDVHSNQEELHGLDSVVIEDGDKMDQQICEPNH
jgi:hypothetical protein